MTAPPLYETIDTSHTFAAQTMLDLRPLVDPNVGNKHETLMYLLGGLYVIAGERDGAPKTQRAYTGSDGKPGSVTYDAYHPEKSPLVDLVYAVGQLLGDPATDGGGQREGEGERPKRPEAPAQAPPRRREAHGGD
jgi:hypothetical protein